MNFDRCRHADAHRLGRQWVYAALSIEHIHAASLYVAAGARKSPIWGAASFDTHSGDISTRRSLVRLCPGHTSGGLR